MDIIQTDGYVGKPSGMIYVPPGEYTLVSESKLQPGSGTLPRSLGEYMVQIGKAQMIGTRAAPAQNVTVEPLPGITDETMDVEHIAEPVDLEMELERLTVAELRDLAELRELDVPSSVRKQDLIDLLIAADSD